MALKKPERGGSKIPFKPKSLRKNPDKGFLADIATKVQYLSSDYHCAVGGQQPARRNYKPASKCPRQWTALEAIRALQRSFKDGFVSEEANGDFPKYIWYREGEDTIYEARGELRTPERFHAYPVDLSEVPRELNW